MPEETVLPFVTGLAEFFVRFGVTGALLFALVLIVLAWKNGEFLSKSQHETIVASAERRYTDLAERLREAVVTIEVWRSQAERATRAAESSQSEHAGIVQVHNMQNELLREIRGDIREVLRRPEGKVT